MANPYKEGDKVQYRGNDDRIFTVHTIYGDNELSLGLFEYPDTEQDSLTTVHEIKTLDARTAEDAKCEDMADVCELAHARTVEACKVRGIPVDCESADDCFDDDNDHDQSNDEREPHYTATAQMIFERFRDGICERTGL